MRSCSVPVRPATGSEASSSRRTSRSFHIAESSETSAFGGQPVEQREPRAVDEPDAGERDAGLLRAGRSITPTPAAVVPRPACTAPSSFTSISAVKLSLTRSIQWTIAARVARVDGRERDGRVVGRAVRRGAGDAHARAHERARGRAARPRARDRVT